MSYLYGGESLRYWQGSIARNVQYNVYADEAGATLATGLTDRDGTPLTQPLTTDNWGRVAAGGRDGILGPQAELYYAVLGYEDRVMLFPRYCNLVQAAVTGLPFWNAIDHGVLCNGSHDDTDNLINLLGEAATGGGTVVLPAGVPVISDVIDVPTGVNLWGQGMDFATPALGTKFLCTSADATIRFGGYGIANGRTGGRSGNFGVDGGGVAANGVETGLSVNRTFAEIAVRNCVDGLLVSQAQNNRFYNLLVSMVDGYGIVFDNGAACNSLYGVSVTDYGIAAVRFQQSAAAIAGIPANPYHNTVYGGMLENGGASSEAVVSHGAGNGNAFVDTELSVGASAPANSCIVHMAYEDEATECIFLQFTGGILTGDADIDAFDLGDNTDARVDGSNIHYVRYLVVPGAGSGLEMVSPRLSAVTALGANLAAANAAIHQTTNAPIISWTPAGNSDATVLEALPDSLTGITFRVNSAGVFSWGSGSDWTPDAHVWRQQAGVLYTPGQLKAAKGISVIITDGAPDAGDAIPDASPGTIAFDDTNDRLYVMTAAGWKYASLT